MSGTDATLTWAAKGAPDVPQDDLIFDIDFLGQPSGVTTGFLWDGAQSRLEGVYVMRGDTAFVVNKGFAYAGLAQDRSGRVTAAWSLGSQGGRLALIRGDHLCLTLEPDPSIHRIRQV